MSRWLVLPLLAALAACQAHGRAAPALGALGDEGEVLVYLRPLPPEAERLSFEVAAISAVGADGADAPLQLRVGAVVARTRAAGDRLVAWGRLPPGRYDGIAVRVEKAALAGEDGRAALVVPAEPALASLSFTVAAGSATVVALSLRYPHTVEQSFRFEPTFAAAVPERADPADVALCANAGSADVTVVDRRARRVSGVLPTGGSPRAVAVDRAARRVYVAAAASDDVDVLDLAAAVRVGRVRLAPGDRPSDLALSPDGRTLVVANRGSSTASFVDTTTLAEVQRVPTGDEPASLVLDREGRRAYVLARRSSTITVLDVPNRAVVATTGTDAEPLRAALDAAGRRLYVVHAGSSHLTVLSVPDLAPAGRIFVGLGASTVLVDPRTDLVYVGRSDDRRIDVFEPSSLSPLTTVDVPAPVGLLAIDGVENTLWALLPEARSLAVLDLTSRALLGIVDVGDAPAALALTGARP